MPYMYALCVCLVCMPCMYVLRACLTCKPLRKQDTCFGSCDPFVAVIFFVFFCIRRTLVSGAATLLSLSFLFIYFFAYAGHWFRELRPFCRCQLGPLFLPGMRKCQKRPIYLPKEAYKPFRRCQPGPLFLAGMHQRAPSSWFLVRGLGPFSLQVLQVCTKEPLLARQRRPMILSPVHALHVCMYACLRKEPCSHGKRDLLY